MQFKNTILLTGAGFTANFGGFLAREMWSKIFNNPLLDSAGNIKLAMRDNFDFEKIYSSVFDDRRPYSQGEMDIYKKAVTEAYLSMNDILVDIARRQSKVFESNVSQFLSNFFNEEGDRLGGYFTLNQDLFPEIEWKWKPLGPNVDQAIRPNTTVVLPTQGEIDQYKANIQDVKFCYVKLHGSINWFQDGQETMVLGINKIQAINNISLLKWYFELFNQALNGEKTKLLIIGYGFRDEHINKCLFDAINAHGLQLYIISPEDPAQFKRKLTVKGEGLTYNGGMAYEISNEGTTIWRAVKAYFPYKLSDIFPTTGKRTAAFDEVIKALG